jgi:predicted nucleic acid-binding protein
VRVLIDANCLVALALPQHEHHAATLAEVHRRRTARQQFILAGHAMVEAYSVLTRLPPPDRLSPSDALEALDAITPL